MLLSVERNLAASSARSVGLGVSFSETGGTLGLNRTTTDKPIISTIVDRNHRHLST